MAKDDLASPAAPARKVHIWGDDPRGTEPRSPHEVLSHGTVFTFGENPTDFDIRVGDDVARIRFEFLADTGEIRLEYVIKAGIQRSQQDPPTVILRFFNLLFAGTFSDGPVRIGTVGNLAVWLCYEISPVQGSTVKRIHYTFWDGSAPDVAEQLIPPGR